MKKLISGIFIILLPFACLMNTVLAVRNPVGSATTPPSNTRSGLIRSPNPIDTSGNLVITGNVGRGMYFRGIVPYRSTSDFSGVLGSSTLDSFIRDSAGSEDFGRHIGAPRPYYSETRSVTSIIPGSTRVFRPQSPSIDYRVTPEFERPSLSARYPLPKEQTVSIEELGGRLFRDYTRPPLQRPMSMTTEQLQEILSRQLKKYSLEQESLSTENIENKRKEQTEKFRPDLKQLTDQPAELKHSLIPEEKPLQPFTKLQPAKDITQQIELQTPKQQISKAEAIDVYEQMKLQIESQQAASEPQRRETAKPPKETSEDKEKPAEETSQPERLTEISLTAAKAQSILGGHKTFASFVEDKFNQHMRAAEDYLRQGKFYRAADVYTLASIYRPADPLPYAGKSHALFAAGEYMSSALFLSEALEIFPEYAKFKVDIEAMIGDRDLLENRIADIEERLKTTTAPELQFLLGYIYYQMDRLDAAKRAIDAAYEKMQQSPPVNTLKKAIDESAEGR